MNEHATESAGNPGRRDAYTAARDLTVINHYAPDPSQAQAAGSRRRLWGNVPARNPGFIGREELLAAVRENAGLSVSQTDQPHDWKAQRTPEYPNARIAAGASNLPDLRYLTDGDFYRHALMEKLPILPVRCQEAWMVMGGHMGGDAVSLAAEMSPYVSAAVGAYGGAVLAKLQDDAADATVGLGRRVLQRIFGSRGEGEALPMPLANLVADPYDEDALGAVRLAIKKALAADPVLAAEVRSMLAGAPGVTQQVRAGRDAYTAGRDQTVINYGRPAE